MQNKPSWGFALRRILSSLAAIAAISAIFGAKALESEHQPVLPLNADLAIAAGSGAAPRAQ